MKLTEATYEINNRKVTIKRIEIGRIVFWIGDDSSYKAEVTDGESAWQVANKVLVMTNGGRKKAKDVANVTNSEICDLGCVIEQIAS